MQLPTLHGDAQAVVAVLPVARPVLQRRHGHRQWLQLAAVHPAGTATHPVGEERAAISAQVAPGHHRIAVDHIAALSAGRFALGRAAVHVAKQVQARSIDHPCQCEPALFGRERAIAAGAVIGDAGSEGGGWQQRGQQVERTQGHGDGTDGEAGRIYRPTSPATHHPHLAPGRTAAHAAAVRHSAPAVAAPPRPGSAKARR